MNIGLIPVNVDVKHPDEIVELAVRAEEAGVESIWTFEHAITPVVDYEHPNPYGAEKMDPEQVYVDPLIALAAIAGATSKIRLGTGINILPEGNPLLMAKQYASLDYLSNGRLMIGAGVGWLKEEYAALGTPWERRGARFDDYLAAMRKVWSGETVEHDGEFVKWSGFKSFPLPVQSPFPIIMGGTTPPVFRRAARSGQGWMSPFSGLDVIGGQMEQLRAACEAEGRDPSTLEVTCLWMPAMEGAESAAKYAELGVDRLVVPLAMLGPDPKAAIGQFADEVLANV